MQKHKKKIIVYYIKILKLFVPVSLLAIKLQFLDL